MLLFLEKHASSSHEISPGSDEDSCEDFMQDKDDNCDDDDEDEEEEEEEAEKEEAEEGNDDYFYKEKRKNETCNLGLPVQRGIENITGYVSFQ
jgi:hypothetical protein